MPAIRAGWIMDIVAVLYCGRAVNYPFSGKVRGSTLTKE